MKHRILLSLIVAASISLLGILLSQSFWLKNTLNLTQRQFDHRANMMLSDVVAEIKTYADTSWFVSYHTEHGDLDLFDVVDTNLLNTIIRKYSLYHELDTEQSYAIVVTATEKILYSKKNYKPAFEKDAYKLCLSCVWHKEYIHLSVYFPNLEKDIVGKLYLWFVLSILFVAITVVAFGAVVLSFFRQKKLAEIKNDFINNMTHELKTPLSTISVASEILMNTYNEAKNNKLARYSRIIYDENHRMRKLVDKVLNISTMERGHYKMEKEEFDIHDLIYKVAEVFSFETCSKEIKIEYFLNAKPAEIYADKLHVRNILNNLIDNAVKYSGNNAEIRIKTETIDDFLKISVADNGIGIPKESLGKVFDKFYRVPSGNIHNVKGFGLGLYYVKTIIEAHGGMVEVDSMLNKGTTVSFYLPR
jgi:two-component system phosphate regulon sensor histidine kinase PhoR